MLGPIEIVEEPEVYTRSPSSPSCSFYNLPTFSPSKRLCIRNPGGETASMGETGRQLRRFHALLQSSNPYRSVPPQLPPSGSARHLLASTGDALKTIIPRYDSRDSKRSVAIGGNYRLGLRIVRPLDAEGSWSCRPMVGPATKDEMSKMSTLDESRG